MSNRYDFTMTAKDGAKLRCYEWAPEEPRAVVVIVHGMAEHAARYGRFAGALNEAGFAAVSMDLRGHGQSAAGGMKGWFAKKNGWKAVLEDIRQLSLWACEKYPGVPLVLYGHSMGSVFARASIFLYGDMYRAALMTAVATDLPLRRDIAPLIAWFVGLVQGGGRPSPLLDSLTFGSFNKPYQPAQTRFEWLNRDRAEVDRYVADDNCGFISTASLFYDVSVVLVKTLRKRNIRRIPKSLPILMLSGSDDPAGLFGKTVKQLERSYRAEGLDARSKIYEGARHELLNEINREEVIKDIVMFIDSNI